jgi:hypothetical protein
MIVLYNFNYLFITFSFLLWVMQELLILGERLIIATGCVWNAPRRSKTLILSYRNLLGNENYSGFHELKIAKNTWRWVY